MYVNDSQRMLQGQEGIPTQEHLVLSQTSCDG